MNDPEAQTTVKSLAQLVAEEEATREAQGAFDGAQATEGVISSARSGADELLSKVRNRMGREND